MEAAHIPYHIGFSIVKPAVVLWIFLLLLIPYFLFVTIQRSSMLSKASHPQVRPTWMISLFLTSSVSSCLVTQPCVTLYDPRDYIPPGSSVHGIPQARILEWVAIFYSRGSSQSRDWTCISCTGRPILYHWVTWDAPGDIYFSLTQKDFDYLLQLIEMSISVTTFVVPESMRFDLPPLGY